MILLVSDKPNLNMIVRRIYHHACLDFIMFNFLMRMVLSLAFLLSCVQLSITMPFLP